MKLKFKDGDGLEVGIDEAGRGCLMGHVFAAAVIWPENLTNGLAQQIKDSKKLTHKKREELASFIEQNAIAYGVASSDAATIDKVNILQATFQAMHKALDDVCLNTNPTNIIVDGNMFKAYMSKDGTYIPHNCIVDGDNQYISIAAASILAKVYHDRWVQDTLKAYPLLSVYGISSNQGYGSKVHMEAIKKFGISRFHRKSFKCCQTNLIYEIDDS